MYIGIEFTGIFALGQIEFATIFRQVSIIAYQEHRAVGFHLAAKAKSS